MYLAVFLVFLYVNSEKENLAKPITKLILFLSICFSASALFLQYLLPKSLLFLRPHTDQFVWPINHTHNVLGSFLVIPLTLFLYLYLENKKKKFLALFLLFFPFFLFSYDKSAYAAFVFFILYLVFLKRSRVFLFLLTAVTLIFFLFTLRINLPGSLLQGTKQILTNRFYLTQRDILSKRHQVFKDALMSIMERPRFGVGPGNYKYISSKYLKVPFAKVQTAHNIFLDVLSEQGIIAGFVFAGIIFLIIKKSKRGAFFAVFITVLVLFQGDYSHRFYSFFLLFFIIAGLIYEEKEKLKVNKTIIFVIASIVATITLLALLSNLFYFKKNYKLAFLLYPLNEKTYIPLINKCQKAKDLPCQVKYIGLYKKLFSAEAGGLSYISYWYLSHNQPVFALGQFRNVYLWDPYFPGVVNNIYKLEKKLYGRSTALSFANSYFQKLENMKVPLYYRRRLYIFRQANRFCRQLYFNSCPYRL
jgi:hypothetical protein